MLSTSIYAVVERCNWHERSLCLTILGKCPQVCDYGLDLFVLKFPRVRLLKLLSTKTPFNYHVDPSAIFHKTAVKSTHQMMKFILSAAALPDKVLIGLKNGKKVRSRAI